MSRARRVLVLAGGPDAEREVSLKSGQAVARALRRAGHQVVERDVNPTNPAALDQPCDVVFPVLHGKWGEGGGLQRLMDQRGLAYVGASPAAAELCMDKARTKAVLADHDLPTPAWEVVGIGAPTSLQPPAVVKALDEGSSLDLFICRDPEQVAQARRTLGDKHRRLLIERMIQGREITVGVLGGLEPDGGDSDPGQALPPIWIRPAAPFYDYQAKYTREDTRYEFALGVDPSVSRRLKTLALQAHHLLGVRHLSRVDFMLDEADQPWILEVNTMPGFTDHSLVPMAARQAGIEMPALVDRLVRLAGQ